MYQSEIAFLFPGQGSQYKGMGLELYNNFPPAREVFSEANSCLGFDIAKMCFEGDEETLRLTFNTQPAVFTVSIAALRIAETKGIKPFAVAGHSLGEYSALVASGAMEFGETVKLIRKRGELMHRSAEENGGLEAMAAILGLNSQKILEVCKETENLTSKIVDPANFNCPGQIVISGNKTAIEKAVELANAAGAAKCIMLNVSGAFHSRLMKKAAEEFKKELARIKIKPPKIKVISNVTAKEHGSPEEIFETLSLQIIKPVFWEESMNYIISNGVNTFVEIGPGRVLSGFMKRIKKESKCLNTEDIIKS